MTLTRQLTQIWTRKSQCHCLWGLRAKTSTVAHDWVRQVEYFPSNIYNQVGWRRAMQRGAKQYVSLEDDSDWPNWSNLIHNRALLVFSFTFVNILLLATMIRLLLWLSEATMSIVQSGRGGDKSKGETMIFLGRRQKDEWLKEKGSLLNMIENNLWM